MGIITPEKLKKERSEFYKIGYKIGHWNVVHFLKEIMPPNEFESYKGRIKEHFDSYPFMEFLKVDEINVESIKEQIHREWKENNMSEKVYEAYKELLIHGVGKIDIENVKKK